MATSGDGTPRDSSSASQSLEREQLQQTSDVDRSSIPELLTPSDVSSYADSGSRGFFSSSERKISRAHARIS